MQRIFQEVACLTALPFIYLCTLNVFSSFSFFFFVKNFRLILGAKK